MPNLEDTIIMGLREIGCEEAGWTVVAQDSVGWRGFMTWNLQVT
jgi:hypothetical protein